MERRAFLKGAAGAAVGLMGTDKSREPSPQNQQVEIRRLSWAGVSIQASDFTLFLDPWEDVSFFGGAYPGPPVEVTSPTARRYVAVTHLHRDHFDRAVVGRLLGEDGAIGNLRVHRAVREETASGGFSVRGQALWEPASVGPFTLVPVPAVDGWGADQVAWVVVVGDHRFFHGGDGLWHGRWWDFGRAYGPIDVAFLPINGVATPAGSRSVRVPRTLGPREAVEAGLGLGARKVVPIHYGVSVPGVYEETEDAEDTFVRFAEERGIKVDRVAPGDEVLLP